MKRFRLLFPVWLTIALAFAVNAIRAADEAPPPAPAAVESTASDEKTPAGASEVVSAEPAAEANAPAEPAGAVESAAETPTVASEKSDDSLREIGADGKTVETKKSTKRRTRTYSSSDRHGEFPLGSHHLSQGAKSDELVSIFGSSTVDGESGGDAVSVFGNTTVNGSVDGAAVSVLGTTTVEGLVNGEAVAVLGDNIINGHVKGDAVAVMGDMRLGPEAIVDGEVTVVGGRLIRDSGAQVRGGVQQVTIPVFHGFGWLHAYMQKCLLWGRLLWFGENLGWAWMVAGGFLVFYLLLALLFPRGIERCAEALEKRPGGSVVAALLTAVLTPVLIVVLALTGIGIALIPLVGIALLLGTMFGKAAVLSWFGRRVLGVPAEGQARQTLLTVLVGGLIVCLIYCVPIMGILLYKIFGALGLGMVVLVVVQSTKRDKPPAPAPMAGTAAVATPVVAAAIPGSPTSAETAPGAVPPPVPAPVIVSAATLPRAGFWVRFAAAFLDFLLIGIASGMLGGLLFKSSGPGLLFISLAAYSAIMWKTKGTTIGGVICGLKLVRLDDRPIDWSIAIVRALSAFLSFCAAGLGFIWVAFDDDRQSWHDKIAGTTIVRVPKGTSLL